MHLEIPDALIWKKNLLALHGARLRQALNAHGPLMVAKEIIHSRFHDYDGLLLSNEARKQVKLLEDPALSGKTFRRDPDQGGMDRGLYPKQRMRDELGTAWLFKTQPADREYGSVGEVAASQILREGGISTPPVHASRQWAGNQFKFGTLQPLVPHSGQDLPRDVTRLSEVQKRDLLASHAGRWLLGDHDTKPDNFLLLTDGHIETIDLGNIYRMFPRDAIDRNYQEFPSSSILNLLWSGYVHGKVTLDFTAGLTQARKLAAIPAARFRKILTPYARARYAQGAALPGLPDYQDFLTAAVDRKHHLVADLQGFYQGLMAERQSRTGNPF